MPQTQDRPDEAAARSSYHHGNLREVLLEATVALAEEIGPEQVTMREVARRAGVSSAAPFRHFPTKNSLMTAVAEEAIRRMRQEVNDQLAAAASDDPLVLYSAVALGYVKFVARNPTYFRILSDRRILDWSEVLRRETLGLRDQMRELLIAASEQGLLRSNDIRATMLDSRAVSYGVVRTFIDGQMPSWDVPDDEAEAEMAAVMHRFVAGIAADPSRHAFRL